MKRGAGVALVGWRGVIGANLIHPPDDCCCDSDANAKWHDDASTDGCVSPLCKGLYSVVHRWIVEVDVCQSDACRYRVNVRQPPGLSWHCHMATVRDGTAARSSTIWPQDKIRSGEAIQTHDILSPGGYLILHSYPLRKPRTCVTSAQRTRSEWYANLKLLCLITGAQGCSVAWLLVELVQFHPPSGGAKVHCSVGESYPHFWWHRWNLESLPHLCRYLVHGSGGGTW